MAAVALPRRDTSGIPSLPLQVGPLGERLQMLRTLSAEGQPEAACRLALELNHCRALGLRHLMSLGLEDLLDQPTWDRRGAMEVGGLISSIADARERGDEVALHCEGISPVPENDAVERFQQLALRGTVRQRVVAALLQPDGSLPRLPRTAVSPLPFDSWSAGMATQFYAEHALEFLDEGYRQRDGLALEGLILVSAPEAILLESASEVLPRLPDPYRFAGYALLAEQVFGPAMLGSTVTMLLQRVLDRMAPDQRERLESEVEREAQRWWNGPAPLPPPEDGLAGLDAACGAR
ncbi:MAG: hypothetical protein ACT4NL_07815 [Pseudomarimonas sp.]